MLIKNNILFDIFLLAHLSLKVNIIINFKYFDKKKKYIYIYTYIKTIIKNSSIWLFFILFKKSKIFKKKSKNSKKYSKNSKNFKIILILKY